MNRRQRRSHLVMWSILFPLAVLGLLLFLYFKQPKPFMELQKVPPYQHQKH